ncbi:hypothetical protein FB567DRAFT_596989 [Paraphoma chrysanthemicola]|uniref:Uncharacterized protein n=1 Tax=Paraphoma chrysanthemicola TaxID=798071 RepID=A0A8K0QYG4_9PLEO|nr:hypothetical protein FB567DRAFT_596989 [Paraphoma chrysanthemicola]
MKFLIPAVALLTLASASPVKPKPSRTPKPTPTPTPTPSALPEPRICLKICYFEKTDCGENGESVQMGDCWTCCRK